MIRFTVDLPDGRGYPVFVGDGALSRAAEFSPTDVAVVSNPLVYDLCGERLSSVLRTAGKNPSVILVEDGEQHKNMRTLEHILDGMTDANIGRDGGVVALGGGVVGDLAGFAAAVYMRGLPVLQIPTTLLAQVDAAIGGKTGVNHAAGKNLIGVFHQPAAVLCDIALLASLPVRDYCAGLAEVIKYGLLGDADFFATLERQTDALNTRDGATLAAVVDKAARGKAEIVAEDEKETDGRRVLLNLGHTFAHAAETAAGYGVLRHGEAVAFGLVAAAKLSEELCGFSPADTARICRLLRAFKLPIAPPDGVDDESLLVAMRMDKKNRRDAKRFVLLRAIGDAFVRSVEDEPVRRALAATR